MKEVTYTSTRLVPTTPEEKRAKSSWGKDWSRIRNAEDKGGALLVFGDWSGYRAEQKQITHITLALPEMDDSYRSTVKFTDGTTMNVWTERVTRKDILIRGLNKKNGYSELIREAFKSGEPFYKV